MDVEFSKFPYQNFALKIIRYCIVYGYKLLSICHIALGHGILKYFSPILDKKDPPEDKELYSICLGHYQSLCQLSLANCHWSVASL